MRIAFFDVDETLIVVKSMFSFLDHYLRDSPGEADRVAAQLRSRASAGVPREQTNREYYRAFAGHRVAGVAAAGRSWFAESMARGGLFQPAVEAEFRRLRAQGATTVLVSGSFAACLDPIAAYLGADLVVSSVPSEVDGVYTGGVESTVIGAGKADVARRVMARQGARPADCVAYGDHASDLPLLMAVGTGVVVGADPVLRAHAAERGWAVIAGAHSELVEG